MKRCFKGLWNCAFEKKFLKFSKTYIETDCDIGF